MQWEIKQKVVNMKTEAVSNVAFHGNIKLTPHPQMRVVGAGLPAEVRDAAATVTQ